MMMSDDIPLGQIGNMPADNSALRAGQSDWLGAALDREALQMMGSHRASFSASGHQHVSVAHQVASGLLGSVKAFNQAGRKRS